MISLRILVKTATLIGIYLLLGDWWEDYAGMAVWRWVKDGEAQEYLIQRWENDMALRDQKQIFLLSTVLDRIQKSPKPNSKPENTSQERCNLLLSHTNIS